MKWVKSVVLAVAMAIVAYGVWSTLTRGSKNTPSDDALSSAPPFKLQAPGDVDESHERVVSPAKSTEGAPDSLNSAPAVSIPAPPQDSGNAAKDTAPNGFQPKDPGVETGFAVAAATDQPGAPSASSMQSPKADEALAAAMPKLKAMLAEGRLSEVHLELSRWFHRRDNLSPTTSQELIALLDQLTGTVVYSREHYLEPAYIIQGTETGDAIAKQYQVPWELLAKINAVQDPALLRPGDQLKVVRGPFAAEIDTQRFEMVLFLPNGRYAGRFAIGVGKDFAPPVGEYEVSLKEPEPPFHGIPYGDPRNPFGKRLLQVGKAAAIHGTNDPGKLGKQVESGGIILGNGDVEDVYDILSKGSTVKVLR